MPQRKALSKFTHTCSFAPSFNTSTSTKSANRAGTACFFIFTKGSMRAPRGAPGELLHQSVPFSFLVKERECDWVSFQVYVP